MWIYADYSQVNGEVKERNRFYKALVEIRKIASANCDQGTSFELKEQFGIILQKCDEALKSKPVARG